MSAEYRGARSDASLNPAGKSARPSGVNSIFFAGCPLAPMFANTSTENTVSRVPLVMILPRITLIERELSTHARWR